MVSQSAPPDDGGRQKWNERYLASRDQPGPANAWVRSMLQQTGLPAAGQALDVACGTGRNALHLAEAGFAVTAIDFAEAALARGERAARERNLTVDWQCADLSQGLAGSATYDLILMIRYLNLELLTALVSRLNPGGVLLVEVHMRADAPSPGVLAGPNNPAFLAAAGAVRDAAGALDTLFDEEGIVERNDGQVEALARFVGRAPG